MSDYYSLALPVAVLPQEVKSPLLVVPQSPVAMKRRVEKLGRYFKRELQTDFPPFEASEVPGVHGCIPYEAYLFFEDARDLWEIEKPLASRFFGVACFRWQTWTDAPAGWSLDWVWFHPYFRRKRHLSKAWPGFREKYGEFHVTQALSAAMQRFLEKHQAANHPTEFR